MRFVNSRKETSTTAAQLAVATPLWIKDVDMQLATDRKGFCKKLCVVRPDIGQAKPSENSYYKKVN